MTILSREAIISIMRHADLYGADLRGVDLYEADLRGANLYSVDLYEADLRGANLYRADLRHADLRHADLRGADMRYADLYGADLRGANLRYATGNSRQIVAIQTNIWPIVYTKDTMAIGCQQHTLTEWCLFKDSEIAGMDKQALEFWVKWKPILADIGVFEKERS